MEIDLHSKKLRNELVNDAPEVIAKGSSEKIINAIDAYLMVRNFNPNHQVWQAK